MEECEEEEEEEFIQNREEEGESHLFILKRSCFVNYVRVLYLTSNRSSYTCPGARIPYHTKERASTAPWDTSRRCRVSSRPQW